MGTFVGGLADKVGRKFMCIMYVVTYIAACCTKLVPEYWTLMLGRFLSGVSTSLLFSVFESWMVCEHMKQGFDGALLGDTFSLATFGNGLVAVVAGLVANTAAESGGFVAPFMVPIYTCIYLVEIRSIDIAFIISHYTGCYRTLVSSRYHCLLDVARELRQPAVEHALVPVTGLRARPQRQPHRRSRHGSVALRGSHVYLRVLVDARP